MKKALLCVGNELRGDDGVAIFAGKIAQKQLKDWKVFFGNDTPESQFSKIKTYNPEILIIIDAVGVVGDEGKFKCEFIDLSDEISYFYNTHNIPTSVWIKYLREFVPKILFLGIGVNLANLAQFELNLTKEAKDNAKLAVEKIKNLDSELLRV